MAIRPLDELTITKIAAGEVVQSPVCALKELLENSLDAGATGVEIVVKGGGLALLQVKDNGGGILPEDLPLLCRRFTTSKIKTLEDLTSLCTFGFRGEALCSISYSAFVTVCTKTKNDQSGYRAEYREGELLGPPKIYPMETGTTISAERMFEQAPCRRETLGSASEIFMSCLRLVQRYALHYAHVQFTVSTGDRKVALTTSGSTEKVQLLRMIFEHPSMENELLDIKCTVGEATVEGLISNSNYSRSGSEFILFVNGRLVENQALKASITKTYLTLQPNSPHFVYLSLVVPPATLDPNIHPTKREVKFTMETEVFTAIQQCIETTFNHSQQQRTLIIRTLSPAVSHKGPSQQIRTCWGDSQIDWTVKKVPVAQKPTENLKSIHELMSEIVGTDALQAIFDEFTYVGACDKDRVLLQYRTGLYLVNTPIVLQELAYQYILWNFAKLPCSDIPAVPLPALLETALRQPFARFDESLHGPPARMVQLLLGVLEAKSAMLAEYFSLHIVGQELVKLPVICEGNLIGNIENLGELILRLGTDVDWKEEKQCFLGVARLIAWWFSQPPDKHEEKPYGELYRTQVFPYLRSRLKIDARTIAFGGAVVKLASTEELYQIFERC